MLEDKLVIRHEQGSQVKQNVNHDPPVSNETVRGLMLVIQSVVDVWLQPYRSSNRVLQTQNRS